MNDMDCFLLGLLRAHAGIIITAASPVVYDDYGVLRRSPIEELGLKNSDRRLDELESKLENPDSQIGRLELKLGLDGFEGVVSEVGGPWLTGWRRGVSNFKVGSIRTRSGLKQWK